MNIYAENILEHYKNPLNKKVNESATITHEEVNRSCGDKLTVYLTIEDEAIKKVHWDGTGCAISQAAMSMLSEELEGMSISNAKNLEKETVLELLGVPIGARRMNCALLGLQAVREALK